MYSTGFENKWSLAKEGRKIGAELRSEVTLLNRDSILSSHPDESASAAFRNSAGSFSEENVVSVFADWARGRLARAQSASRVWIFLVNAGRRLRAHNGVGPLRSISASFFSSMMMTMMKLAGSRAAELPLPKWAPFTAAGAEVGRQLVS